MKNPIKIIGVFCLSTIAAACGSKLIWEARLSGAPSAALYVKNSTIDSQSNRIVVGAKTTYMGTDAEGSTFRGFDPLIAKYDLNGNLLWEKTIQTPFERTRARDLKQSRDDVFFPFDVSKDYIGGEEITDVLTDDIGNIYALARVLGSEFNDIETEEKLFKRHLKDWDVYLYKFDSNGVLVWSQAVASSSAEDNPRKMQRLSNGNIVTLSESIDMTDQGRTVSISAYSSEGNLVWNNNAEGSNSALGVNQNSVLIAVGGLDFESEVPMKVLKFDESGALNWSSEHLMGSQSTRPQPRCSGDVGLMTELYNHDIQYINGEWIIASSSSTAVFACGVSYLGKASISRFSPGGVLNGISDLPMNYSESDFTKILEYTTQNLRAPKFPESFDLYPSSMRLLEAPTGYFVAATMEGIYFYDLSEDSSIGNWYTNFSDVVAWKLDDSFNLQWRKRVHSIPKLSGVEFESTSHRMAGASVDNEGKLLIANHAINMRYNGAYPTIDSYYTRTHQFDADGSRKTLSTSSGLLVRSLSLSNDGYSIFGDSFVNLSQAEIPMHYVNLGIDASLLSIESSITVQSYR